MEKTDVRKSMAKMCRDYDEALANVKLRIQNHTLDKDHDPDLAFITAFDKAFEDSDLLTQEKVNYKYFYEQRNAFDAFIFLNRKNSKKKNNTIESFMGLVKQYYEML